MKKIAIFMACAALMGATFTSCKQDTLPRIQTPTEFVLNTPPMAEQTYLLSPQDGIDLSVSQANYGMGLIATYTAEISLKEDFKDYRTLPESYTSARFTVPGESLSLALCDLLGYVDEASYSDAAVPVYVRVVSSIPNWNNAEGEPLGNITSNVIELKSVVPYFAVKLKDNIWIIGAFPAWDNTNDTAPLVETEVESRIYQGTYEIPAGKFQLRFYDKLGDWDGWSIGAQDEDSPVQITFTDGVYEGPCFLGGEKDSDNYKKGKGAWEVADWPGGKVKFTIDLSNAKKPHVIFEIVD